MIPTDKRGWGAADGKNKPTKVTPRLCVSPQLAPPILSPANKKAMAATEDYHKKG